MVGSLSLCTCMTLKARTLFTDSVSTPVLLLFLTASLVGAELCFLYAKRTKVSNPDVIDRVGPP